MYKKISVFYFIFCLLLSFAGRSAVVKGTLLSRQFCNTIDYITEFKVDGQPVLKRNYQTSQGKFILENIENGKHTFEITCQGHYKTLILDVIIDKDTVNLPVFKLHASYSDGYTDLRVKRRGFWPTKYYYEDGTLSSEGKFKFKIHIKYVRGYFLTVKNGPWKHYNENGCIRTEINYKDGTPDGVIKEYDFNGKIFFKGFFCEGNNCGQWVYYGKDGKIDCIAEFVDNKVVMKFSEIYDKECFSEGWIG